MWHFLYSLLVIVLLLSLHSQVYVLASDNGLGLAPQMGFNTWNTFACSINESLVRDIAKIMATETILAKSGYQYVNLDDCWQVSRDSSDKIVADPKRFPSGIKALADYVHSLGLKFGIYSDAGTKTCAGRPGSLNYEKIDANTYADWTVDYLKYDNCNNQSLPIVQRYKAMSEALNMTNRHIFFSICDWGVQTPWKWAPILGNSWRTTYDIKANWSRIIDIVNSNLVLYEYAGPGGWNDADMLEVGHPGLTINESISHFSLWAVMKSPLLIGCDIRVISKEYLNILTNEEVISINQDPLGKQAPLVEKIDLGNIYIFNGELANKEFVVLILNLNSYPTLAYFSFSKLGIPYGAKVSFRDLWLKKDVGTFTRILPNVYLAAHGVAMFRCKFA